MARVDVHPNEWLGHPGLVRETYARLTAEGILLASLNEHGRLNPMTIGWCTFGAIWGRPMCVVLVRPSRHTYTCIERTGDFTVNVLPEALGQVPDYCGTVSGRSMDKLRHLELDTLPSKHISSSGIACANIVLECKVVHRNDAQEAAFPEEILASYYPGGDFHRVYFGQVLGVSVDEAFLAGVR
ncbi:MAG TPA: flavin reductase family protein [Phycisphaerae bacterium]|nr:flavin reductase family protein [Phycisphaerae bacterium]HNU44377.1 flavin reductase family protein [Phycisphaerae bacterium]